MAVDMLTFCSPTDDTAPAAPPLTVPGNLDKGAAAIETDGDVIVRGDIADRCRVESGGDVSVAGAVDAAFVTARRDINVIGGIVSRGRGSCSAGRDLFCRFASNATLRCGRNLLAKGDMTRCRIFCGGKLQLERGTILAGHIISATGVACRAAGSPGGTPTTIECNVDPILRDTFAERLAFVDSQRLGERRLRRDIDQLLPLFQQPGASRPELRSQVDRLQRELERQQTAGAEAVAQLRAEFEFSLSSKNLVVIDEMLHRDVTFRFPGAEATVSTSLLGPLRVRCKTIRGRRQIIVEAASSVIELETHQFPDEPAERVRRMLMDTAEAQAEGEAVAAAKDA